MAYAKPRRIVTMTPNKLIVYFVADILVADMVLADIDFFVWPIWFFPVADIVLLWPIWLWPIWSVADMVAPRWNDTEYA